jgi:hypothetical protein
MNDGFKVFKSIRRFCLDCCGGGPKDVKFCPSTTCELWPARFGCSPKAATRRLGSDGKALLDESNFQEGSTFGPDKSLPDKES